MDLSVGMTYGHYLLFHFNQLYHSNKVKLFEIGRSNRGYKGYIQLFRERLSDKMCTRQSQKEIWDMINTL